MVNVRLVWLLLAVVACLCACAGRGWAAPAPAPPPAFSLLNQRVPAFSVIDTAGQKVTARAMRGRPTVLLVFCTCESCRVLAREWARAQHEPQFRAARDGGPSTLVVYAASSPAARAFAASVDLDPASTTVTADPEMTVARTLRALPCPSLYVVDGGGVVRYSSKEMTGNVPTSAEIVIRQALTLLATLRDATRAGRSGAPPPALNGPVLSPVPGPGFEVVEGSGLQWRARGVVIPIVSQIFTFRNDGTAPIEVVQVQASCGCGAVGLAKDGHAVPSAIVQPGETIQVWLTATLTGAGPKIVYAWIYSRALAAVGYAKLIVTRD